MIFRSILIIFTLFSSALLANATSAMQTSTTLVKIHTSKAEHVFHLEIAASEKQQEDGLMFRKAIAPDGGMLFQYDPPRPVYMWMRNTLIPLDMLFVSSDGTIQHIVENAAPHSEEPRGILSPSKAVLELRGGTVKRLGIARGDQVTYEGP